MMLSMLAAILSYSFLTGVCVSVGIDSIVEDNDFAGIFPILLAVSLIIFVVYTFAYEPILINGPLIAIAVILTIGSAIGTTYMVRR